MKIRRTHIPEKISKFRDHRISQEALMVEVQEIFDRESKLTEDIVSRLQESGEYEEANDFNFDILKSENIYHLADIERICIDYRLRFLPTSLFKSNLPYEAVSRIRQLEKNHQTSLQGFKIMAPASAFKLQNADDPLLFAPLGNDYYYLIHTWGRDLHPFRKLIMWPFRNFENFVLLLLAISFILTLLIPQGLFSKHQATTSEFIMTYFFMFKWVAGIAIFYGFKKGKNFSSAIWRSRFYNA